MTKKKARASGTANGATGTIGQGAQPKTEAGQSIRIINPEQAPTIYCNFAQANMNAMEIRLRVCEMIAATEKELTIREVVHIVMPPGIAKAIHELLGVTLEKFEQLHSPIGSVGRAGPAPEHKPVSKATS